MLYEFKCNTCKENHELFFVSHNDYFIPPCPLCGSEMNRVYTAPALQLNKVKVPRGTIELGNEYPDATPPDPYAGVEEKMHEVLAGGADLDGSGDYELNKLSN